MISPLTFGKVTNPCGDCWDGECTMNCSPRGVILQVGPACAACKKQPSEDCANPACAFRGAVKARGIDDLAFAQAERDAAIEVSEAAKRCVAAMETKLACHERELADLIAAFYRREIGTLMQQAEHWAKENYPLATHHRVMKADSYYQIVALCERFREWDENPFRKMREELAREPIKPPGTYPPTAEINAYRHPRFVVEKLKTATRSAGGDLPNPIQPVQGK